jgi:hypothetical protein
MTSKTDFCQDLDLVAGGQFLEVELAFAAGGDVVERCNGTTL